MAGTTAWSPPRTSGEAGLRTVVLERRPTVGGAAATSELAPGARVPTLAHTVGRLRPSVVRDLELKRHGLSLVGPEVRAFAPGTGRRRDRAVERRRPDRRGPAGAVRRRRRRVCLVRRAGALAVGLPRRDRRTDAARHRIARSRRRPRRAPARADVPWPGPRPRPDDHPRAADGDRRLRGRILRDRRAPGRASPGGASSTPRWGRGRRARPRSCWPIRPATTGAPPARRSSRAAGPGRWRRPSRRPPGKPASRSGPAPRSPTSPHGTGGRPASSWPAATELTARAVVAGIDPEARPHRAGRSRGHRPEPALAGRQHPDAGDGRQGQPRALRAAGLPGRRRRRAAAPWPDPHRPGHRCHGAGPRCGQVRPLLGRTDDGGDDPVARRSRRSSRARRREPTS